MSHILTQSKRDLQSKEYLAVNIVVHNTNDMHKIKFVSELPYLAVIKFQKVHFSLRLGYNILNR